MGAPSTVDSSSVVTATPSSVAPHSSDDDREEEAPPQKKGKGKGKKKKERKSATERLAEKAKQQEWSRSATTVTKTSAADDARSIVFGAMQAHVANQDHAWPETVGPYQKVKPAGARVWELALRSPLFRPR